GIVIVLLVVVCLAVFVVFADLISVVEASGATSTTWFSRLKEALPLQAFKIVIIALQIVTQFSSAVNVTYPKLYDHFLDALSWINLDFDWMLSAGCIVVTDFHDKLLLSTLSPLVVLGILRITYMLAMWRNRGGTKEAVTTIGRKHMSMALLVMFLVYSSVSATIFRMFACDKLDDGGNYLRADYRLRCNSPKHHHLQVYAAVMMVVYPLGIPLVYGVLLFRNREELLDVTFREENPQLEPLADLWQSYKPDQYYYEVVESVRRIMLTGVVVFIYPNSAAQVAITFFLALGFLWLTEVLRPYQKESDAWLSRVGHFVVLSSMYVALLLKVDVSDENGASQDVFSIVLIVSNCCMFLAVIAEALL
ncbi:unnamed protein product, partial [Choristocarpus tenellus]